MWLDFLQEITLADLCFIPHGSIAFEYFGLGDLEKRPNVQRHDFLSNLNAPASNTSITV